MNRGCRYGTTTLQTAMRNPVNKGKRKGRDCDVPALMLSVELTNYSLPACPDGSHTANPLWSPGACSPGGSASRAVGGPVSPGESFWAITVMCSSAYCSPSSQNLCSVTWEAKAGPAATIIAAISRAAVKTKSMRLMKRYLLHRGRDSSQPAWSDQRHHCSNHRVAKASAVWPIFGELLRTPTFQELR
jgi:hypothetical protein